MSRISRPLSLLGMLILLLVPLAGATEEPWSTPAERSTTFEAVVDVFRRYYWDPGYRDWQQWAGTYRERALTAGSREAFDLVMTQMVRSLGDEHSAWLGQVAFAAEEEIAANEERRFGFQARLLPGAGLVVERVYPGSAAALAGLQRGDVVVRVSDFDLAARQPSHLVWELLAEASGRESVEFELLRGSRRLRFELVPAPFELELARDMPQAEMLDDTLGYLYLPSFNRFDIGEQVHRLLAELQSEGLAELVIDLRGNPGGRVGELGVALGAFIDGGWARATSRGQIVWEGHYRVQDGLGSAWLEDPNGRVLLRRFVDSPTRFSGPLAVLVDRSNSSAGELAALVLQAQGRALVVGEPTGGNVEAVRGFDLPDGSLVMVAVANLEGPDGLDFSEGVTPDVPAHEDLEELARGYDAPLAQAIRLLRRLPFTPNRYFGEPAFDTPF